MLGKNIKVTTPQTSEVFAQWKVKIDLAGKELDCYVLNTKQRVIALRATLKAIADANSGDLAQFIGVSSLQPFINKDLILAELMEFSIPGTQFNREFIVFIAFKTYD